MSLRIVMRALLAAVLLCASSITSAGLFRTYLSINGSDANPCTLVSPCRLLPAALAAVNDGGEVWILDSGNFNTSAVIIGKSVSILAIPGAVGSIIGAGGSDAFLINAVGGKVALRNLVILQLQGTTSANGVDFQQGAELLVEDCEIANLGLSGIAVNATSAKTVVRNTVLRNNNNGILAAAGLVGLDRVSAIANANFGIFITQNGSAQISNSVFANNGTGIFVFNNTSTTSTAVVTRSVISGNGSDGVLVQTASGSTATVTVDANSITYNGSAFSFGGTGANTIYSVGNNTLQSNGSLISGIGSLTALGTM